MSEDQKNCKNLTKCADFLVLLSSKIIPIINNRLSLHASDLNNTIKADDIAALKKKHLIWVELLKNYTSLTTSVNNIIGFDHTMNYSRKTIFKYNEKNLDYIQLKGKLLLDSAEKFADDFKVVIIGLDYFAKKIDLPTSSANDIKNLTDVHNLMNKTLETFTDKHLSKVKQYLSAIPKSPAKKGGYESVTNLNAINNNLKQIATTGGFDNTDNYEVVVGGDVVVSGFKADNFIKDKYIQLELIKQEADKTAPFIVDKLNELIYSSKEQILANMPDKEIFAKIVSESKIADNLQQSYINFGKTIEDLLTYHKNRFPDYNVTTVSLKNIMWDDNNILGNITQIIDFCTEVFHLIDAADVWKITNNVSKLFKQIASLPNTDTTINDNYKIIMTDDFSFESRRNAKRAINQHIQNIRDLVKLNIPLPRIYKVKVDSTDKVKIAEHTLEVLSLFIPSVKEYERKYDNIVNEMHILSNEIYTLISPDNKHTCIKRSSLMIETLMLTEIKKIESSQIHKNLIEMLGVTSTSIYNSSTGLNKPGIELVSKTAVGFVI